MPYNGISTLDDVDVTGKRVLLRVAYDVPIKRVENGELSVEDDTRLTVTIPTIQRLQAAGCAVVICGGWLGRPDGKVEPDLRMDPVATRLSELLGQPVPKLDDCVGPEVEQAVRRMQPGELILLENTRFHPEEAENDPAFVADLAKLGELCVFDAFAQAHRTHASTTGLVQALPTVLGPLMVHELTELSKVTDNPNRPLVIVLGGAKITDKIALLRRLVDSADKLLIGGALANVFLKAKGIDVGQSRVDSMDVDETGIDPLALAKEIIDRAGDKLLLPVDLVAGDDPKTPRSTQTIQLETDQIPANLAYYDIGLQTSKAFIDVIRSAKTVFWNGLLGVSEVAAYRAGTKAVATAIARQTDAVTIVGGGDTAEAVTIFGLTKSFAFVSTGGGASLEVVSGKQLPVLEALIKGVSKATA